MTASSRSFCALVVSLILTCTAMAQDWPTRAVRIVSPFAAGGSSDTVGRVIGESLSEKFGQQFVLENRGGAGGLVGSAQVASAPADGYTFLISSIGTHVIAPLTSAKAGYDPVTSFTNVAYVGGPPIVIVVHPSLGVKSLSELVALLKKQPEPMPYVSPGPGTLGHLVGEYWAEKEKVRLAHVAYKGSGQAMNDLVAGHVKLGSLTWTAALGQMKGGTVIPIAVSSARRMPGFESVPTLRELGYADMAVTTWFGFAAPANLPASDHAADERGDRCCAGQSEGRRAAGGVGLRARKDVAGRADGLHQERSDEMGAAREAADPGSQVK